jgi:hypothetical protein
MSSLTAIEKRLLEQVLEMGGGYVLDFSDRTFGDFVTESVELDIHNEKYCMGGNSKAKKMRGFWDVENDYIVGTLLKYLLDYKDSNQVEQSEEQKQLESKSRQIVMRLLNGAPNLDSLKKQADIRDARHLKEQIKRLEESIEKDPGLAIGTAKELIETCCKTILADRGKPVNDTLDIPALTKATLKELKLVPEGISDSSRGADIIKRLLQNLGAIGNGLAELRSLYGTGHGKDGRYKGLAVRHAKLAVGAASTLTVFLFETHEDTKVNENK